MATTPYPTSFLLCDLTLAQPFSKNPFQSLEDEQEEEEEEESAQALNLAEQNAGHNSKGITIPHNKCGSSSSTLKDSRGSTVLEKTDWMASETSSAAHLRTSQNI